MDRDPTKYQIVTPRGTMTLAEATREEIEAEMMRAYDVIQHIENMLGPINKMADDFIMGRDKAVDAVIEQADAEG